MILVVGATGSLGEIICRRLREADKKVRAMVRVTADPKKVDALTAMGAEIVYGDLKDPTTLENACVGVDAVITTATAVMSRKPGDTLENVDQDGSIALIEAACLRGVKQFVYLSFPEMSDPFPLQNAKRMVEAKLEKSPIDYTVLRPTYFMEVWLGPAVGFDPLNGSAVLYGNGDKAISWISINDVAEAVVRCLDNPAVKNQIVELGGPHALSPREVVSEFEKAGSGPVALTVVPKDMLEEKRAQAQKADSGVDSFQQSIDALIWHLDEGKIIDMSDVQRKIPITLTSVSDYIRTLLSSKG